MVLVEDEDERGWLHSVTSLLVNSQDPVLLQSRAVQGVAWVQSRC